MMTEANETGSDGVSREFDPRFSRAFQPGYDPRVHREAPPGAVQRDEWRADGGGSFGAAGDGRVPGESGEPPVFAVPESEGNLSHAEWGSSGRASSDTIGTTDAAGGDDFAPTPWRRRVNPWLIALWVLGAVFILAGVGMISLVDDITQSSSMGNGMGNYFITMLLQMTWFAAPMIIVLGLATLTSTVVIQAVRWRRT